MAYEYYDPPAVLPKRSSLGDSIGSWSKLFIFRLRITNLILFVIEEKIKPAIVLLHARVL